MTHRPTEEQLVSQQRGKWSQPGVPHKGWICVDIEDLGSPSRVCEMCESQEIRYAHHMQHTDWPDVLICGCVCAGNMEEDLITARARDNSMRNRASRRSNWLSRQWKTSKKGNPWIKVDGYRVTVYQRGKGWGATVARGDEPPVHIRRTFPTPNEAKLAAFDYITRLST
jgi:hypothetical protein